MSAPRNAMIHNMGAATEGIAFHRMVLRRGASIDSNGALLLGLKVCEGAMVGTGAVVACEVTRPAMVAADPPRTV